MDTEQQEAAVAGQNTYGQNEEVKVNFKVEDNKLKLALDIDFSKIVNDATAKIPGFVDNAIGNTALSATKLVKLEKSVSFDLIKTQKEV